MTRILLHHISKSYPGVQALKQVDLNIVQGEIQAICGENGAGKSTLMHILSGNLQPDSGIISIENKIVAIKSPRDAFSLGISTVHQHLSLVDNLSVAENIFANLQPINSLGIIQKKELYKNTQALLDQLNLDIDPKTLVRHLSPPQQQMVEIAKALAKNPTVLILDEPTASLTEKETKILFTIIRRLKNEGKSILYISHRLDEVFLLADRITILKDGVQQGSFDTRQLTMDLLIKKMVGREIKSIKSLSFVQNDHLLEVRKIAGQGFKDISFLLKRGEILGMSGLVGSGRTAIARAIFGVDPIIQGEIIFKNNRLNNQNVAEAIHQGIAYVPEDRKSEGLFQGMSLMSNVISVNPDKLFNGSYFKRKQAEQLTLSSIAKFNIKCTGIHQKVIELSGGNQQKIVLAKWLNIAPDLLIVDEPTHGIDIGAKFEIYELLQSLAQAGKGILMISSDLPELLGICDRILVIKNGNVAGEFSAHEATEEKIINLASNE
ncbi:MAG: sugar ABC transporter ATP-binding protein [Saprospiraceae bacterium]